MHCSRGFSACRKRTIGKYELYCDECADAGGSDLEGMLPVVNSPHMGVCGYIG